MAIPSNGLYRTTLAHPLAPEAIPGGTLVFVGRKQDGAFVVAPHYNERNRWFWREPVTPLADDPWVGTLKRLPAEGFYTLPRTLEFDAGGKWLANAIVQLGYDKTGTGILFIAEQRSAAADNALFFSEKGHRIDDTLLEELRWAPILPVREDAEQLH